MKNIEVVILVIMEMVYTWRGLVWRGLAVVILVIMEMVYTIAFPTYTISVL